MCFVLMPFGVKTDTVGRSIDFDRIYDNVIKPAVRDAQLEPLRADEEKEGGIIHRSMYERLLVCPYAVADLTLANANVFYELGVRHAARPQSTVLMYERSGQRLPFDVAPLRTEAYTVDDRSVVIDETRVRSRIAQRLRDARDQIVDSPLYQSLPGIVAMDVSSLETDGFRERVRYRQDVEERLAAARYLEESARVAAVKEVHASLRPLADKEAGIAISLLLSYRDADDLSGMLAAIDEMAATLAQTAVVQEQRAFALNRLKRGKEAERILLHVIEHFGPSSETLGLLGRVYKDRWAAAKESPAAPALLSRAIEAYRRGFESDWREPYPGVNAVTLLEAQQPGQPAVAELSPVVRYAAHRKAAVGGDDYWTRATLLELAVSAREEAEIERRLTETLAEGASTWMRMSTAGNLRFIADARDAAGETTTLLRQVIVLLENAQDYT